jgi:hypothetical protein
MFLPNRKHIYGPSRPVKGIALVLYTYTMFLPNRKHLRDFAACYRDSFTLLLPHRKHSYGSPRPVTGIASVVIHRCSYLTGNAYETTRPFMGTVFLFICRLRSYLTGNTFIVPHGLFL